MTYTDPETDEENAQATLSRKDLKQLRQAAKEGREAKERLAHLERERSFVAAGVPLDDKRASYFIAGYQGETTPDAIKQEWQATFGQSQTPEGQPSPIEQELDALNGAVDLTQGGNTPPPNQLAQRNSELAALSDTDPRYDEKFRAIMVKHGSKVYNPNTG